jgi:D-arabinose 1-dehydrogenase-like Zn-dependent alcohol dehydrogenase
MIKEPGIGRSSLEPGSMRVHAPVGTSFGVLQQLDVEVDDLAPDEVLVGVIAAGVWHSDLTMLNREMVNASSAPRVLGHESGGVVERLGERVSEFSPGDHVVGCGARAGTISRQERPTNRREKEDAKP